MGLAIATVADSISKLSITGLTIQDVDAMTIAINTSTNAIMAPVEGWITNFELVYDSQGSGDVAQKTVRYDLNYRLYYRPVGSNRDLLTVGGLVDMIVAILDAVVDIVNLTGAVEIMPTPNIRMGVVVAPDGSLHFGCDLGFRVMEFDN